MIKSFLTAERIRPIQGRVLIEVIMPTTERGMYVPPEAEPRYAPLGLVCAGGEMEGLKPGDMIVLHDEGSNVPRTYYDVFKVVVKGEGEEQITLIVDNDIEPFFRERVEKYRANPSTEDVALTVRDMETDQVWSFLTSDVLDWTWDGLSTPTYKLEYIPTFMIDLWDEAAGKFKLHYLAHITSIMCSLRPS